MKNSGLEPIAQRYAKALFDAALEQKAQSAVEKDMASLVEAIAQSADLRMLIASPLAGKDEQVAAMGALLKKMGGHALSLQFVELLARKKRLPALASAAQIFVDMAAATRGEMKAEMITATKASKDEIALAEGKLSKIFAKKVTLSTRENPELLGGAVIRVGSTQLDGSIAGKLDRLGQKLKTA